MSQVDVFLFSLFHVDHSGDFPALIFSSWFEDRKRPLPIYEPPGNDIMPGTTEFVRDFFKEPHGPFRYLSDFVEPGAQGSYELQPHGVPAGSMPVLVFRNATGLERRLHMPPSVIGSIAANAHVKQLVLSHRMLRTLGKESETQSEIKRRYTGPIAFANDLDCFPVK
jgi:ribonuclease BN (tRNA processing enzyme)